MLNSHLNVVESKLDNYIKIGEWLCSEQQKKLFWSTINDNR